MGAPDAPIAGMAGDDVEARAAVLIGEFSQHFKEYVAHDPSARNQYDRIFQSWAIQKIAGLQLCVEQLGLWINAHAQGHAQT